MPVRPLAGAKRFPPVEAGSLPKIRRSDRAGHAIGSMGGVMAVNSRAQFAFRVRGSWAAAALAFALVGVSAGHAEEAGGAAAPVCAGFATAAVPEVLVGDRQGGNGPRYEQLAADMLALAEAEIAAGQVAGGCRLAAVVAGTFAGSAPARAAARMLGTGEVAAGIGGEGDAIGDVTVMRWREIVVRATAAQDDLRDAVGDRVFFSAGSAELDMRAVEAVRAQAGWLARHHGLDIVIEGHADDGIVDSAQLALSESRAFAVKRILVERGLASARIAVIAFGHTEPIALCDDAQCRAQNRRAVTRLVPGAETVAR